MLPPEPLPDVANSACFVTCFFDFAPPPCAIFSRFSMRLRTLRMSTASILPKLSLSSAIAIYFDTPRLVYEMCCW